MSEIRQRWSDLHERIILGEDTRLELKEVRFADGKLRAPIQNDLADELAAFANRWGGTLVFGVADKTREVVGIPLDRLDAVEKRVLQACEDSIEPKIIPMIERLMLPDSQGTSQSLLAVEIPCSEFVHRSPSGYVMRVGSSKRQMPTEFLARLLEARSNIRRMHFDESPVAEAPLAALEDSFTARFLRSPSLDSPRDQLRKVGMVAQDSSGRAKPTVAGLLMACRCPDEFLPGAYIQAVAYRGTEVVAPTGAVYQRDAADITGPLDRQIFDACDFVRKNMRIGAHKHPDGGRVDLPQFDMLAVFEAVTNSVAHRDYSMAGSRVRLRLFDDRLELYTPGRLPNTLTPELLEYRQVSRNPTVTSLLARCPVDRPEVGSHRSHIMDRRGEGVPVILSRSEDLSDRRPTYRMPDASELILTIFAPSVP